MWDVNIFFWSLRKLALIRYEFQQSQDQFTMASEKWPPPSHERNFHPSKIAPSLIIWLGSWREMIAPEKCTKFIKHPKQATEMAISRQIGEHIV